MGNQVSSQGEDHFVIKSGGNFVNGNSERDRMHSTANPTRPRRGEMLIAPTDKSKESLSSGFFKDNISSYKGVITDASVSSNLSKLSGISVEKESTREMTDHSTPDEKIETKDFKVPMLFEWKEGGGVVYLTGSFCNWNQKFLMNQIGNKFEIALDLPRAVYQYKFVVDNKWMFSKHHPTCNDGRGNINNIIDSTNHPLLVPENTVHKTNTNGVKDKKASKNNLKQSSVSPRKNIHLTDESYNSQFPTKKDLHVDSITCPDNYKQSYSLSGISHRYNMGRTKYMQSSEMKKVSNTVNNSYSSVPVPSHVNLNHLSVDSGRELKNKKSTSLSNSLVCLHKSNLTITTSSTQRVRNKFVTIIYYKPVN